MVVAPGGPATRCEAEGGAILERCMLALAEAQAVLAEIQTIPLDPNARSNDVRARRQARARSELIARAASLLHEAQTLLDHWHKTVEQ